MKACGVVTEVVYFALQVDRIEEGNEFPCRQIEGMLRMIVLLLLQWLRLIQHLVSD